MRFRRRPNSEPEEPPRSEVPGVPGGASTTYAVPGTELEWPAPRQPGVRLRLVPNETLLHSSLANQLGDLAQVLIEAGADAGVSIEIDTSDRTRPGEMRGGASPIEGISLVLLAAAAGFGGRQLERLQDRVFDAMLNWALRHREKEPGGVGDPDPISVTLYGPDGEVLKDVLVPQGQGEAPPEDRLDPRRERTGRD